MLFKVSTDGPFMGILIRCEQVFMSLNIFESFELGDIEILWNTDKCSDRVEMNKCLRLRMKTSYFNSIFTAIEILSITFHKFIKAWFLRVMLLRRVNHCIWFFFDQMSDTIITPICWNTSFVVGFNILYTLFIRALRC